MKESMARCGRDVSMARHVHAKATRRWLSATWLGGMVIPALGCTVSVPTSVSGPDSGNPDAAMTAMHPTGAQPAEAGSASACNTCATAAESAGGQCGSLVTACASDSACKTLVSCVNACATGDTICENNCANAAGANAVSEYQALGDCVCGSACGAPCAAACGTPPTTGTAQDDSGTAPPPTSSDPCAAAGCPTLTTMPADFAGYCPNAPGTMRVCDCPGAGPPAPCTAATQGANLYCCP